MTTPPQVDARVLFWSAAEVDAGDVPEQHLPYVQEILAWARRYLVSAHPELDRRKKIVVANAVERWRAEGQCAGREQRILVRRDARVAHLCRDGSLNGGACTSLLPPTSPGSDGRKLRSQASQRVREKGKNTKGRITARSRPTISMCVHG